jgi:FAD/FMN-containing dehydrogenase
MPTTMTSTPSLSEHLKGIVGAAYVLTDPDEIQAFVTDWRGRFVGSAQCVVRPADTAEVAAVVKACLEAGAPIVPQGGNTSLCGAATPDAAGQAVVVSLSRLNRIAAVDAKNNTISVGAGCTLAEVQAAAREVDRLFPLALASEGTCQIGGNLSTNAGGVQVLRYGNTRELTLGLEVVLPSGEIWDGLRGLRKDNTGYDLKQLFIGAEGTLGIITGAVLKLFPLPKSQTTCWLNLATPVAAVDLLNQAKTAFDGQLTAFELVSETALGLVLKNIPNVLRPASVSPWYVLAELSDTSPYAVEYWLHARLEAEEVLDAVIAQSETQAAKLWALRENISEAQKIEGVSIKHDVAVPVSAIPAFLAQADAALARRFPVSA